MIKNCLTYLDFQMGFSIDNLIKICKIIFSDYRLPHKMTSDGGTNFAMMKF